MRDCLTIRCRHGDGIGPDVWIRDSAAASRARRFNPATSSDACNERDGQNRQQQASQTSTPRQEDRQQPDDSYSGFGRLPGIASRVRSAGNNGLVKSSVDCPRKVYSEWLQRIEVHRRLTQLDGRNVTCRSRCDSCCEVDGAGNAVRRGYG